MNLSEAMQALDPTNDDHWTDQGQPRLSALKELTQDSVTRQQILSISPKFSRKTQSSTEQEEIVDQQEEIVDQEKEIVDQEEEQDSKPVTHRAVSTKANIDSDIAGYVKSLQKSRASQLKLYRDQLQAIEEAGLTGQAVPACNVFKKYKQPRRRPRTA